MGRASGRAQNLLPEGLALLTGLRHTDKMLRQVLEWKVVVGINEPVVRASVLQLAGLSGRPSHKAC